MGAACHPFLRKCDVSNLLVAPGLDRQSYDDYPDDEMEYDTPATTTTNTNAPAAPARQGETDRKRGHESSRHHRR